MKWHIDQLDIVVFVSGAVVMIIELVGSRILAPYLGLSLYVWTSIIGVILAALSIGYILGGYFADKNPSYKTLRKILLNAGLVLLSLALLKDIVPAFASYLGPLPGSLVSSVVLFLPGSILLAMVSPYALKLRLTNLQNTGATAGNLYAFSTVGSIVGTFFAGYVLIPNFHTSTILIAMSMIIIGTTVILEKPSLFEIFLFVAATILVWATVRSFLTSIPIITWEPSAYALITVRDTVYQGRKVRLLMKDAETHSGMYLDGNKEKPVFPYLRFFKLDQYFSLNPKRALLIGAGSYASAKDFLNRFPEASMDVVEIDPKVTKIAKQYFDVPETPRLTIIHEDGRLYINQNKKKYDIIYNDSFSSYYSVPYQLTTQEALFKIKEGLAENGIVIANMISALDGQGSDFFKTEYKTFESVFPHVYAFMVNDNTDKKNAQNIILVGIKNKNFVEPDKAKFDDDIKNYLSKKISPHLLPEVPILTDDFAPVDNYIARLIFAHN